MTVPVEGSDATALFRHCWLRDRKPIDGLVYCLIWLAFNCRRRFFLHKRKRRSWPSSTCGKRRRRR